MAFKSFVAFLCISLAAHTTTTSGRVKCPDGNVAPHAACCLFFALRNNLQNKQNNTFSYQCGEDTHETVCLSFHDTIAFSPALEYHGLPAGGGANGSMLIFPHIEPNFHANLGISDSVEPLTPFLHNHTQVSAGDLVQFAAAVALGNCPGAPKLEFMAGHLNATAPSPDGLIPEPQDSVNKIFTHMKDGGNFSPDEVVALLVSHSIARADHVDTSIKAVPFNSAPFTFDTQVFLKFLLKGTGFPRSPNNTSLVPPSFGFCMNVGEMHLQFNLLIARDPCTACMWRGFINEQEKMSNAFKDAMTKHTVIGQNPYQLVDCSEVILDPIPASGKPATYTQTDVEVACYAYPFLTLTTDPGATETIIP
ncbi:manganese-dependent peroxidase [Gautieria morchelliformis]|nr:manganese-dependent peroxidase [Gautieria morchelliformis]